LEIKEREAAVSVLPRWGFVLAANVNALITRPLRYLRGALTAAKLAGPDLIRLAMHSVYFVEAVAAGSVFHRRRIRHVHTHFSSTVTLLAREVFEFEMSTTIHGPDEFLDVRGFGMGHKVAASRFVVAISDYGRSQILRAVRPEYWDRVHVCRLGVNPEFFSAQMSGLKSEREFTVLCVARLAPVKAQRILIQAIARLRREGHVVALRLVGGGPDRAALERLAASLGLAQSVHFEGVCSQDRVRELCEASDCFVLASFAEGIPVALMEAMAAGLPCVATWVNGVPELIEQGVSGLLVAPGNVDDLVAAITTLLRSPEKREELRTAAQQRIRGQYDLRRNVRELAGLHARVTESVRPAD
jgi:glycosyltransferase involved in cell wall biosynthesis